MLLLLSLIGFTALTLAPLYAHNGTAGQALPVEGIVVDAGFDDWPAHLPRYALEAVGDGDSLSLPEADRHDINTVGESMFAQFADRAIVSAAALIGRRYLHGSGLDAQMQFRRRHHDLLRPAGQRQRKLAAHLNVAADFHVTR